MTEAPPPFYNRWHGLAATAAQLLARRREGDARRVEAGEITQAEADDRSRIMGALATMWRAVVDQAEAPKLDAYHAEIRNDLLTLAFDTKHRAAARPDDTALQRLATYAAALKWNHRPCLPGHDLPWILHVHAANLAMRPAPVEQRQAA
ncbi:hypothetical protein [Sphingomonas sp. S2-65]|uniref:hypothetical protein n=1 Tax=Sphingomonas sp. S2-65 TaxID=2903960 RepID=UPI001F1A23D0|nr:hypothetical protein [Sphingomonas sp. S2-65]UYY60133.1 hypothetical protein LZ586_08665 [Sphingomonas sp. S2-65]